jgi:hypothetical protein
MTSKHPADAACRAFLANLADHISAAPIPGAALRCAECRRHLLAARTLAGALRQRPEIPEALRQPAILDGIYESAVDHAEVDAPLGAALSAALLPVTMPVGESVLETAPVGDELARNFVGNPASAPSQLWQRVRLEVQSVIDDRRRAIRRKRAAVAVLAAAGLLLSLVLIDRQGTKTEVSIVFEDMAMRPEMDIMPVAVLRSALR